MQDSKTLLVFYFITGIVRFAHDTRYEVKERIKKVLSAS